MADKAGEELVPMSDLEKLFGEGTEITVGEGEGAITLRCPPIGLAEIIPLNRKYGSLQAMMEPENMAESMVDLLTVSMQIAQPAVTPREVGLIAASLGTVELDEVVGRICPFVGPTQVKVSVKVAGASLTGAA